MVFALAAIVLNARYLPKFFGDFNRRPEIYHRYHEDFMEACRLIRPDVDKFDGVFITSIMLTQPYILSLVALDYDPQKWVVDLPVREEGAWDWYYSYGKMHFMFPERTPDGGASLDPYSRRALQALRAKPGSKVLFIVRPGEPQAVEGLGDVGKVIHEVVRPDGKTALVICEKTM